MKKYIFSIILATLIVLEIIFMNPIKEFAIKILSEKNRIKKGLNIPATNFGTQTEYDTKIQLDSEALAILDIDFTAILKMEQAQSTTREINSIKAMLKNKKDVVSPAQTTLSDFENARSDAEDEIQNNLNQIIFRITPKFINLEKDEKVKRIRKYLIKDISEELYRLNFELFKKIDARANDIYTQNKNNIEEIKNDKKFAKLQEMIEAKRTISNLLTIFGGLANSSVKDGANDIIALLSSQGKNVENKFHHNPTIEQACVLQVQKMLKDIDKVIENALKAQEENAEIFSDATSVVSFMNVWFSQFNDGQVLTNESANFGDSVNAYTNANAKKISQYTKEYNKGKSENLAESFEL